MSTQVVVIAGGTASGKTTLAGRFCERTGARLLSHDRYYFDVAQPRGHNYDHPDSLDTTLLVHNLAELRAGRSTELPVYDFASHTRQAHTETLAPGGLVVVEGILVLADPRVRGQADLRVFVHAPADLRLVRRLRRDMAQRGRSAEGVLDQYMDTVRPMHEAFVRPSRQHAQLELDGTGDLDTEVARLAHALGLG